MAITSVTQLRSGDVTTLVAVSDLVADVVYFDWYVDGAWIGRTTTGERAFQVGLDEQVRVDVLDTDDSGTDPLAAAPEGYPARRELWWTRSPDDDVTYYVVEQKKDAGAFEQAGRVLQLVGAWTLRFLTERLDDLATYTWRITPYDVAGNAGTPIVRGPEKIVRRPDAPTFDAAFSDDTKWVTFAEEDAVAAPRPTYAHTIYLRRRVAEAVDVSVAPARAFRVLPPVVPPPQPVDNLAIYARRRISEAVDVTVADGLYRRLPVPPWSPAIGAAAFWDAGADSFVQHRYGIKGGYDLVRATDQHFTRSGTIPGVVAGAPSYPLTIVSWCKNDSVAQSEVIAQLSNGTNNERLVVDLNVTTGAARAYASAGGANGIATAAAGAALGRWQCVIAVFTSAASRSIYSDVDTTGATETTARAPSGLTQLDIGRNPLGAAEYDGVIGSTWILAGDLSGAGKATERAAIFAGADALLATGFTAHAIYRLDNDAGADASGNALDLTPQNAPTAQNVLIVLRDRIGSYHLRATTSAPTWSAAALGGRGGAVFTAASSQFLTHDVAAPVTAAPFQVYVVASATNDTGTHTLFWLGDKDATNEDWFLQLDGASVNDPARWVMRDGGAVLGASSSSSYAADATHLLWGLETSNVSRAVRIDGAGEGTNATDLSPDGADRVGLGGALDSTPSSFANATIGAAWLKASLDVSDRADVHAWVNAPAPAGFGMAIP